MNTMLFTPISIGPVELPNRIAVPPMAMYSARSGVVQLFHKMHYGHLAASGAGLVCIESTAVSPDGRITNYDLGLWSDECEQGLKELVDLMHEIEPECRVMVQLNHAGRKASSVRPWRGPARTLPPMEGGWRVRAPSPIPFSDTYTTPREIEFEDCRQIAEDFGAAAARAARAGVDAVEIHMAHGYLIHQFLSPLSNHRIDEYGGALDNRCRFAKEVMNAVKAVNDGTAVGVYRDRDKKVPVLLHTDVKGSWDMESVEDLPIWNGRNSAPLGQVANSIGLAWEYPLVRTYDRKLSMAAQCDVKRGHTMKEVHSEIREEIERIRLPEGYTFFWDSQYKDQKEAMAALTKYFPLALIMLLVILVMLFGNFRQPLIIFLILPLSLIGMVFGLWVTGFQFGFFCIAGWLGLLGMIIKNVIVLLDEVNIQQKAGVEPYTAVIEATVSRARPVLMAALTTVFGLSFATLLTLFVTPALYTVFYKISKRGE